MTRAAQSEQLDAIAQKIKTAGDLWDLQSALIEFETHGKADDDGFETGFDSENELKHRGIDICELPTFGGVEPKSTVEVWSWDEDHILAGIGAFADWEIQERMT